MDTAVLAALAALAATALHDAVVAVDLLLVVLGVELGFAADFVVGFAADFAVLLRLLVLRVLVLRLLAISMPLLRFRLWLDCFQFGKC
ncbi:hypothetical protein [Aliiroseovarius sp.]|uniref:hypothetical protein n=1 Tax=Aliiroseovarius sp. TaxID=1872442 RepID=UPI003BAA3FDF